MRGRHGCEQIVRRGESPELMKPERQQRCRVRPREIVANYDRQVQYLPDGLDAADQVDSRADDGEVESVDGADIAIDRGTDRAVGWIDRVFQDSRSPGSALRNRCKDL